MARAGDGGVREHLAWLIWCIQQGYVKAEDRAHMTNWLLDDLASLHPADAALRPDLLAMADAVLTALSDDGYDIVKRPLRPDCPPPSTERNH